MFSKKFKVAEICKEKLYLLVKLFYNLFCNLFCKILKVIFVILFYGFVNFIL